MYSNLILEKKTATEAHLEAWNLDLDKKQKKATNVYLEACNPDLVK